MTNSDNPKQLTVGQLMDALEQCNRDDPVQLVQVIHNGGINYFVPANLVFVERTSKEYEHWDYVVYLHTETLDFIIEKTSKTGRCNEDKEIRVTERTDNFAKTIREEFLENI
jgi:hypothetical protein